MNRLRFTNTCELDLGQMVTGHYWNLRILPHDDPSQTITLKRVDILPDVPESRQRDGFGNIVLVGACAEEHDKFGYLVSGEAEIDASRGRGTHLNPVFRFPSTLTKAGPSLEDFHQSFVQQHGTPDPNASTEEMATWTHALSSAVHDTMDYVPGSTTVLTTAEEALAQRKGVCQDYAHVLLALLRMDQIPARYVGGLMLGEGATHAWVEYFDGKMWWGVDPTNDCDAGDSYIALVRGRDHYDCPMERGVLQSSSMQRMATHVKVEQISQQQ